MKLKCIGGQCDGQHQWIDRAYLKIGDVVQVIEPFQIKIEDFKPSLYEEMTKSIVQKYHNYIIDCLKYANKQGDKSEIWFLRPQNLTTFDAMQLQFLK